MRSRLAIVILLGAVAACARARAAPPAVSPAAPQAPPSDLIDDEWPVTLIRNAQTDTPSCLRVRADFEHAWKAAVACRTDAECALTIGNCTAARSETKADLERRLQAVGDCVSMIGISICKHTTPVCFRGRCKVRGCQVKEEESECS